MDPRRSSRAVESAFSKGARNLGLVERVTRMSSNPRALVQKLWNYSNILRDDGVSFRLRITLARQDGDFIEHA